MVGIACAYHVPAGTEWILEHQLRQVARCTRPVGYRIYAADIRLPRPVRDGLAARGDVVFPPLGPVPTFPNREHGQSLTQLVRHAVDDGCDLVVTLDVDSFPVSETWIEDLAATLRDGTEVAAVDRAENGDRFLPHPSGTLLTADFVRRTDFCFYPDESALDPAELQAFRRETGQVRIDTGIGLALALWRTGRPWHRLRRTNVRNRHPLFAGLYGGAIFHLGATSRVPLANCDFRSRPLLRLLESCRPLPLMWRLADAARARVGRANGAILEGVRAEMERDFDALVHDLSGSA
jgi:hypothetical protein